MRQFSIIVPLTGDHETFERTLGSVLRYQPPGAQVVVPVPHGYSDPCRIAGEVELVPVSSGPDELPGSLWQAALSASRQELVALFLPGVELSSQWHLLAGQPFDNPTIASVSPSLTCTGARSEATRTSEAICGWALSPQAGGKLVRTTQRGSIQIDGPTRLAGVFRNEALGWLPRLHPPISSTTFELEQAAALKALGFRSHFHRDWVVAADRTAMEELGRVVVGGLIAERLLQRHTARGTAGRWKRLLGDALSGNLMAGFGRLSAGRHETADRDYSESLQEASTAWQRLQSLRQAVERQPSLPTAIPQSGRRAA